LEEGRKDEIDNYVHMIVNQRWNDNKRIFLFFFLMIFTFVKILEHNSLDDKSYLCTSMS